VAAAGITRDDYRWHELAMWRARGREHSAVTHFMETYA
jgi:hypothetical protein